jgi:hypothetical protein
MTRTPVIELVSRLLDTTDDGYTYPALARAVYGVDEPSASQLAVVRRAVGRLVAAGQARRGGRDKPDQFHTRRTKQRVELTGGPPGSGFTLPAAETVERRFRNPGGVLVYRAWTPDEQAAITAKLADVRRMRAEADALDADVRRLTGTSSIRAAGAWR